MKMGRFLISLYEVVQLSFIVRLKPIIVHQLECILMLVLLYKIKQDDDNNKNKKDNSYSMDHMQNH